MILISLKLLFVTDLRKFKCQGVNTIAQACFCRAIVEDMAEVTITTGTYNFNTYHSVGSVFPFKNAPFGNFAVEARPSTMRIKFAIRIKKDITTTGTFVHTFLLVHQQGSSIRTLCSFFS